MKVVRLENDQTATVEPAACLVRLSLVIGSTIIVSCYRHTTILTTSQNSPGLSCSLGLGGRARGLESPAGRATPSLMALLRA